MNKDILRLMSAVVTQMISDDAPTRIFVGCKYEIKVSPNPDKIYVKDLDNGKERHIGDLNELEVSLLYLISSVCLAYHLYEEEE